MTLDRWPHVEDFGIPAKEHARGANLKKANSMRQNVPENGVTAPPSLTRRLDHTCRATGWTASRPHRPRTSRINGSRIHAPHQPMKNQSIGTSAYQKNWKICEKRVEKSWRPQGDLNPCYRRERPMS